MRNEKYRTPPEPTHYGMTEAEARARYKSSGNFEGPLPLCGNGSYHCTVTRNKSLVTCEACQARL